MNELRVGVIDMRRGVFVEAVRTGTPMTVDIHAALDMTVPCILGLESVANDGAWMPVPDSRTWGAASGGEVAAPC